MTSTTALIRVSELVDSYRDLLSGATDMYLSTVANRQGEINKQLTIIATIFLPLTFLTGFFGQNFAFLTGHILNHTWTVLGARARSRWPRLGDRVARSASAARWIWGLAKRSPSRRLARRAISKGNAKRSPIRLGDCRWRLID